KESDIPRLVRLQRAILDSCRQVVSPGGLLIFAVCSPEPEEGEQQVDWLLRAHPEFALEPPPGVLELPLERGFLRTLPGEQSWDGFFAARLRRGSGYASTLAAVLNASRTAWAARSRYLPFRTNSPIVRE